MTSSAPKNQKSGTRKTAAPKAPVGGATQKELELRQVLAALRAYRRGEFAIRLPDHHDGVAGEICDTFNSLAAQQEATIKELSDLQISIGREGHTRRRLRRNNAQGGWNDSAALVNQLLDDLTVHTEDIARVVSEVSRGDLDASMNEAGSEFPLAGDFLRNAKAVNGMVQRLRLLNAELTRVSREVGTEGKLGAQAQVPGVSGAFRDLTLGVNLMASNLTSQVREIARVTTAVAAGDLTRSVNIDAQGEVLELKRTINTMVGQLSGFAGEVSRVAREVGVEGRLGGQALVVDSRGVWKELTDNVNLMASNLTSQVRDIAAVTTAVARGDLTRKVSVDARGEILELKSTVNTMVEQLSGFAVQVTQLATDVGVEGKLGGEVDVRGVRGTWLDLTDAVNSMANNLTAQVRSISQVATAIAAGDLQKKIDVDARGEILDLKETINTMVGQLSSFAGEVSRVAREVGTEGMLGGQASVEGVRGTWKELTDNVNSMASNLTNQVRDIAQVATAIAEGDLDRKITVQVRGEMAELKGTINTMVDQLSNFAEQVSLVSREVGVEGKLGGQAHVRGVSGVWKELTGNVNLMALNLTNQVRDIAQVTTAVAMGDLSKKITVEVRGEILALKNTVNTMVEQLRLFSGEVTRVAREVGTEGVLGGQAQASGLSGTWRELTDNVNIMARNLTEQVRGIARVVTAVAQGDLKQELRLESRGEIATLVDTINGMTVTLSSFADQVSDVAHDVGVEGRLGGQADVLGASGIWRDLTNNVNELAGNLTRQVRAIFDVATAVTDGDLTRTIDVEARGELAALKDNLNQMIRALADTTKINEQQDWLKTNLARFTRRLQGQRDLLTVSNLVLSELAQLLDSQHGAFFMAKTTGDEPHLELFASYAMTERKQLSSRFAYGEGLVGQTAREKKRIVIFDTPSDYIRVSSALGDSKPLTIVVAPILFEDQVKGVIELASFTNYTSTQLDFLDQFLESLGIVVATIEATMRTDDLLRQSQTMAEELQTQQEELQQTNEELEEKARQLTAQKEEVEQKNTQVELAKEELEEKAEQLALTSRYKSQFLANMSHELRTPLNSLLILSKQLADNHAGNLDKKQVEYASTVHQAGSDLLSLINEILDLAKIESGTMAVDMNEVALEDLKIYLERAFQRVAEEKGLSFQVTIFEELPERFITDDMRLKQILRNLVSNALKFTHQGRIDIRMEKATVKTRQGAEAAISFFVKDDGIGIPADKQAIIFEAFQQADGSTSRRYGGTGLGLSISREITKLLGGELSVASTPGKGSTFRLVLPLSYHVARAVVPQPVVRERELTPLNIANQSRKVARQIVDASDLPFPDDRSQLEPGDRVLLVIEDDPVFAAILRDMAQKRGFKCIVALSGHDGLALAKAHRPDAISLDLALPDMDGWVVLDRLKHEPDTRHVPVHILSAKADKRRGYECGALAVLEKPVTQDTMDAVLVELQALLNQRIRKLLLVEDDETQRLAIIELVGDDDLEITAVANAEDALRHLEDTSFDCMVLDLKLPGMSGLDFIQQLRTKSDLKRLPIIVYTGKELTKEEQLGLSQVAETVIIKDVRSPERLLQEAALFLHRREASLPEGKRKILRSLVHGDPALQDKTVLVVDDDVRNIFAITTVLEQHQMIVINAENGREALTQLAAHPQVEAVLMDIMMPEMDGYEAIRQIRKDPTKQSLPIIALTAKAMRGDREKCIEAGASDYVTKPVDPEQLISLLRVWLYR